jgi:lysophospholipase L1-like esterase
LDLFEKLSALQGWEGMMIDGLHFNAAGNAKVGEVLVPSTCPSLD